jgi:hypothetical protein
LAREVPVEHLHCDASTQPFVRRVVHLPHATRAENLAEPIPAPE